MLCPSLTYCSIVWGFSAVASNLTILTVCNSALFVCFFSLFYSNYQRLWREKEREREKLFKINLGNWIFFSAFPFRTEPKKSIYTAASCNLFANKKGFVLFYFVFFENIANWLLYNNNKREVWFISKWNTFFVLIFVVIIL